MSRDLLALERKSFITWRNAVAFGAAAAKAAWLHTLSTNILFRSYRIRYTGFQTSFFEKSSSRHSAATKYVSVKIIEAIFSEHIRRRKFRTHQALCFKLG